MTEKNEALRLADALDVRGFLGTTASQAAAELRRLHASCEDYAQHKQRQDQRILTLYAQRDALLRILKSELQHAEWQDKIIYPVGSENFQNWRISIYLPVPLGASDKSPQAALDRLVDAAIKVAQDGP